MRIENTVNIFTHALWVYNTYKYITKLIGSQAAMRQEQIEWVIIGERMDYLHIGYNISCPFHLTVVKQFDYIVGFHHSGFQLIEWNTNGSHEFQKVAS